MVPSNMKIMPVWKSAYFQYSSITHSKAENSWNWVTGPSSCSVYNTLSVGTGTSKSLRPKRVRSVPGASVPSDAAGPGALK